MSHSFKGVINAHENEVLMYILSYSVFIFQYSGLIILINNSKNNKSMEHNNNITITQWLMRFLVVLTLTKHNR